MPPPIAPLTRPDLADFIRQNVYTNAKGEIDGDQLQAVLLYIAASFANLLTDGNYQGPPGTPANPNYAALLAALGGKTDKDPVTGRLTLSQAPPAAPQWKAGKQVGGALVFDQGLIYRVKQDIANGQSPPASNPAGYLLVGPIAATPGGGPSAGGFALRSVSVGTGGEHVIALPTAAPRDVARYVYRLLTGGPVTPPPVPGGPVKVFRVANSGARTGSAGIYTAATPTSGARQLSASAGFERLVDIVAGNEAFPAGGRDLSWAKTTLDGDVLTDEEADACYAKVRLHNITTRQLKVLGNTSNVMNGSSVWNNSHQWRHLACTATHGYPAVGATEGTGTAYVSFLLSDPNTRIKIHQQDNHQTMWVAVDQQYCWREGEYIFYDKPTDTNYYWHFLTATRLSDNSDVVFEAGMPLGAFKVGPSPEEAGYGSYSAICRSLVVVKKDENAVNTGYGSGLAAQQSGNFVFVARMLRDEIAVVDKVTGATLRTWSVPRARQLTLVDDNTLWLIHSEGVVEKFLLNESGVGTASGITIAGLVGPVALGMLDPTTLGVAQGSETHDPTTTATHGYKGFDATTGAPKWSEINEESYSENVRVLPKKHFLTNTKSFTKTLLTDSQTYICGQPDGKYWLGDVGSYVNWRFLPSRELDPSLPDGVGYIGHCYSVGNDGARPTDIYFNYGQRDYDPDTNQDKLVANYSANWQELYDDPYNRLNSVYTYDNGVRCVLLQRQFPRDNALMKLVALRENGMQFSERFYPGGSRLDENGDLVYLQAVLPGTNTRRDVGEVNAITQRMRCVKTGQYDQQGLPLFAEAVIDFASPPVQVNDPVTNGGFNPGRMVTENGTGIFFSSDTKKDNNPDTRGGGWHIGGMAPGGTEYLFKGIATTHRNYQAPYPTDNTANGGRGVVNGVGTCFVVGKIIFTQYYGEFDNGLQANKIHRTFQDGLPLGVVGVQNIPKAADAPEFLTSNTKCMFGFQHGNRIITGQNDEGFSGGIMLIEHDGLDTIEEATYELVDGQPVTLPGVALLPDVPFDTRIRTEQAGLTFSPDNDALQVLTSLYTYGEGRDISILWRPLFVGGSTGGVCNIATMPSYDNLTSWRLQDGAMRWFLNAFNDQGQSGYLEQLDTAGKLIWQLTRNQQSIDNLQLVFNNQVVASRTFPEWAQLIDLGPAFRLDGTAASLTLTYGPFGPFTVNAPLEAGANILAPGLLRARFDTPAGGKEFGLGFTAGDKAGSLRFISNPTS